MKYLSFALIIMSVSAVPFTGLIMSAKYSMKVNLSDWAIAIVSVLIVFISALAMFH